MVIFELYMLNVLYFNKKSLELFFIHNTNNIIKAIEGGVNHYFLQQLTMAFI